MARLAFVALILPSGFQTALVLLKKHVYNIIEIKPQTKSQSLHKSFFVDFQIAGDREVVCGCGVVVVL